MKQKNELESLSLNELSDKEKHDTNGGFIGALLFLLGVGVGIGGWILIKGIDGDMP